MNPDDKRTEENLAHLRFTSDDAQPHEIEGLRDVSAKDVQIKGVAETMAQAGLAKPLQLPYCRATMQCLRGPCLHYWDWTQQAPGGEGTPVLIQRADACMRHIDLQSLAGDRVFSCNQWFPAYLAWIPASFRPFIREKLVRLYDAYLLHVGEPFDWRWWPRDFWYRDNGERIQLRQNAERALARKLSESRK